MQGEITGPLSGIKVIDLTSIVMGPFATQFLGDMGADVIKVEPPHGDVMRYANHSHSEGMSNIFMNSNRNKRSLVLNLKHEMGRDALLKLVAQGDVLVSNIRPQAMARLGLSYEDAAAVNPQIIYVACFGFGQDGPYAERTAYDDLIQTMSGVPNLFERAYGDAPKFLPANFCDRVTGLNVVNAVTAALFYRERTGKGQAIEVPMFETMVQFLMSDHLGGYTFEPPEGVPGYERIVNPNRRPYATKDGYIGLLVYNDKQWAEFLQMIDRPNLIGQGIFATMKTRGQNIVEVYGFVQDCFRQRTTAEWLDRLSKTDLPHAAVSTLEDVFADEHLQAINFFPEQDHPSEGRIRTTAIPSTWSESQPSLHRHTPLLGQDSREVLRELGYDEDKITALVDAGTTT
ncbi:MAG: CoA transferase [Chloroflexota bacterium]